MANNLIKDLGERFEVYNTTTGRVVERSNTRRDADKGLAWHVMYEAYTKTGHAYAIRERSEDAKS